MIFFLILFFIALAGISVLFVRHVAPVRAISRDKLSRFVEHTPSFFHEALEKYIAPFGAWCKRSFSFILYHIGEWFLTWIQKKLLYIARRLQKIADYLHGRKTVMRQKGQSPFWDSMHEWKEDLKNENENINHK